MRDDLGAIEVGQRADLVLLDINTIPFTPFNNPLHQLVYCLPSSTVRTVLVEGQVVVQDGRLTRVDDAAIISEGNELGRGFVERSGAAFEVAQQIFPAVAAGYRHAVAQDVGARRHIGHEG
jgi:5-methylthioadenosine/S-adenosylhomocysteine deaminase